METRDEAELCFPQLLNTSCKKPGTHYITVHSLYILLSCMSLLTVTLNLLVIISVSHFRQLHTPTNLLLRPLAVSDLLVGLVVMPGVTFILQGCWIFGDHMCVLLNYLSFIISSATVGNIVLISVDRYVAICDPLHYTNKITTRRVRVCICLCWLCSVLYNGLIFRHYLTHPERSSSCIGECVIVIDFAAAAVDVVLTFILPVTVIFTLYMRVFVVAMSQARAMRSHISFVQIQLSGNVTNKKSELKAARTLGVVILVFLMCFCPYYCVSLAGDGSLNDSLNYSSVSFIFYIFYFNSCLNPVIYALFYPWFRKAVKLIVTLQILQLDSCETNMQ